MIRELVQEGLGVRLKVFGTSMLPIVPPGATVVIGATAKEDLRVGDLVALEHGDRTVCHVVEEVTRGPDGRLWLRTAGTSAWPDPLVPFEAVLGRVIEVQFGPLRLLTRSVAFEAMRMAARPFRPFLRLLRPVAGLGRVPDILARRGLIWVLGQAIFVPVGAMWGLWARLRYELDGARKDLPTSGLTPRVVVLGKDVVVSVVSEDGQELGRWRLRRGEGLEHLDLSLRSRDPAVAAALLRGALTHSGKVSALVPPFDLSTMALFRLAGASPVALALTYRRRGEKVTLEVPLRRT